MSERMVPIYNEKTVTMTDWIGDGDRDQLQGNIEKAGGVLLEAHQVESGTKVAYKVCTTYPECDSCVNNATCPIPPVLMLNKAFHS